MTTLSSARKTTFGAQGRCSHELAPRRAGGQRWRHHSWARPIQVILWNTIFIAESKAGFLITPGTKGREAGDQIWRGVWEHLCEPQAVGSTQEPPFFFFWDWAPALFWGGSEVSSRHNRDCLEALQTTQVMWVYCMCSGEGKGQGAGKGLKRKISGPLWLSSAWTVVLKGTAFLQCTVLLRAADSCRRCSKQQTYQKEQVPTPRLQNRRQRL